MCSCPRGFSSPRCYDINECSSSGHGCQHNCVNTHGSYRCTCRAGFTLTSDLKSCQDLNECNVNNGGCSHKCNNNVGSFSCSCRTGYTIGTDGRSCNDVDECMLGTAACSHKCTNTEGSFTCSCNTGYTLSVDRRSCEDVDECVEGTAKCDGYCNNTPGSYTCYCDPGYIPDSTGYSCRDVNECDTGNGGCTQTCINEPGSHRCECQNGYKAVFSSTDSEVCEDIDECMESSAFCSQICNNTVGSFKCICNSGFSLDTDGISCIDVDDCEGVVCMNKGTCVDGLIKYTCTCETGFRGKHCETDINECEFANGGCQDVCTNSEGSFYCSCSGNRELSEDGFSCFGGEEETQTVFERLEIPRQLLPKACFTVTLAQCVDGNDITIYLSSTSHWYKLHVDQDVMFTYGVVFANVNNFSVPISLKGLEVIVRNDEFTLNYGSLYELTEGAIMESGKTDDVCAAFELVESDIFDFISMDSFMKTLLFSLFPAIPSWLRFEKSRTEILSIQDTKSTLVYGKDMDDVSWCDGAPVISNHLYTVFKFSTGFKLNIFGDVIDIPKPLSSRRFCLIVDLCQHNGGTVFLMIPDGSRDMLLDISMFQALKNRQNLHIRPRGIGISLSKGINANYHTLSGQLWNGDRMFTPLQPNVDVWIGGGMSKNDTHFTVEGNADIYFGVPSVQTILTSMFVEEWTGFIDIQLSLSPVLRFDLFGKERSVTLPLLTSTANAYISIGEAPKLVKQLHNQTVLYGSDVTLFCNATGDPEPDFIWLRNEMIIPGESSNILTILNVTEIDSYDKYNCIAGNVVANITSSDAYINVVLQGSYICSCFEGYSLDEDGITCSEMNVLMTTVAAITYVTTQMDISPVRCKEGYNLHENDRTCTDMNECLNNNGGCFHTCSNTEGSFICSCIDGYDLHTDRRTCIDNNECLDNNGGCAHICTNTDGSFTCACNDGFDLQGSEETCIDIDECVVDNGGCDHNCRNTDGSFTCFCNEGFSIHKDNRTCVDINECIDGNGGCDHICSNLDGSFSCSCNNGYSLDENNRICIDINECLSNNGGCDHACSNKDGSFICFCEDGYNLHENNRTCIDINECLNDNGGCNHMCNNTIGQFTCTCKEGYNLHEKDRTCTDINECLNNNGGCLHTCSNTEGSFMCSCNNGYDLHTDRQTCIDNNECLDNNGGCGHICTNNDGSIICSCNAGYSLHDDKKTCVDINECLADNGGCGQVCINVNGSFSCSCTDGYKVHANKKVCIDINECLDKNGGCKHKCENLDGSFKCMCQDGYNLDFDMVSCFDINECADQNGKCEEKCINFDGTYKCVCEDKRLLNEDGLTCKDVSEQAVSSTIRLSIESEIALRNYSLYTEIRKTLEGYFRTATKASVYVYVNSIRAGSIIVDYTVIIDDKENQTLVADTVVQAILDLDEEGSLDIDGNRVSVKPILPKHADPCYLRELLAGQCDKNSRCQVVGNKPICRNTYDESVKEDYLIIVGPVLGVVAFVVAVILMIMCALQIRRYRKQWWPNRGKASHESGTYEAPPYLGRKNLIWNFNRGAACSASLPSFKVNGGRSFPWMAGGNDLNSPYMDGQ
ncbi:fibrillin-2-like [Ruditapes philippinarum]|uniref:fibrillin-2-like n=1 Tax=Ruditapes philippinarum TaxID=129788 RepID=UPI00295B49CD|nr:fibrillin-2-like [Ruditapes philippinarum]